MPWKLIGESSSGRPTTSLPTNATASPRIRGRRLAVRASALHEHQSVEVHGGAARGASRTAQRFKLVGGVIPLHEIGRQCGERPPRRSSRLPPIAADIVAPASNRRQRSGADLPPPGGASGIPASSHRAELSVDVTRSVSIDVPAALPGTRFVLTFRRKLAGFHGQPSPRRAEHQRLARSAAVLNQPSGRPDAVAPLPDHLPPRLLVGEVALQSPPQSFLACAGPPPDRRVRTRPVPARAPRRWPSSIPAKWTASRTKPLGSGPMRVSHPALGKRDGRSLDPRTARWPERRGVTRKRFVEPRPRDHPSAGSGSPSAQAFPGAGPAFQSSIQYQTPVLVGERTTRRPSDVVVNELKNCPRFSARFSPGGSSESRRRPTPAPDRRLSTCRGGASPSRRCRRPCPRHRRQ